MVKAIVFLLLGGPAQAALLMDQMNHSQEEAEGDLAIKMPDAVTPEIKATIPEMKTQEKPQFSQSLVESQSASQLGMFESGVLKASLKPIVKAKVKKVAIFLETHKGEYEHATEDRRVELKSKLESLIMMGAGTRGFVNEELCNLLWGIPEEWAGGMSATYCPDIAYTQGSIKWFGSTAGNDEMPPLLLLQESAPSRLRTAYLTQYFGGFWILDLDSHVIDMLADDVTYFDGTTTVVGKASVSMVFPTIGLPETARVLGPYRWHCDESTCIVPVLAWASHDNYCLFKFSSAGMVEEIIVPLNLWR